MDPMNSRDVLPKNVPGVGWGGSWRGGVGHAEVGWSGVGHAGWAGLGGSCRGGMGGVDHAGVGWIM